MPPNNVSKKSTASAKYKTPLIVLAIVVFGVVVSFFLIIILFPHPPRPMPTSFGFNIVTVDAKGNKNPPQSRNGEQFTVDLGNGVKLDMVSISEGTFLMGSPDREAGRTTAEGPQHNVTVKPFYMSRFPVTQAQWEQVANLPQAKQSLNPQPSTFMGASRPVETVSWEEAVEFCERLTHKFGGKYSLPSEAQWEYACRANTTPTPDKPTTPFYFGETITPELANYDVNYPYGSGPRGKKEEYNGETIEVNHHQAPNNFGLEDMHGNVWEWCADPWHENYKNKPPLDGSVWESDDKSSPPARVVRGGAWHSFPSSCRCATRTKMPQNIRTNTVGFRVVWFPPQNN